MSERKSLSMPELEARLAEASNSPKEVGVLELIVRRPRKDEREVLQMGTLDLSEGLVGDNWKTKGSSQTADGSAHPEMQITIMNSRVIALLAGDKSRWKLAGDQLYIDLDLSESNLPPTTRLALGSAILEVTAPPHTGCQKFIERFGADAMKLVNSPTGRNLNLRGVNAKVIQPGEIHVGDEVRKLNRA